MDRQGTWFSGMAAARSLAAAWQLDPSASAWLTNATQYGFIPGTFLYALTNLADRFNARRVFCASADDRRDVPELVVLAGVVAGAVDRARCTRAGVAVGAPGRAHACRTALARRGLIGFFDAYPRWRGQARQLVGGVALQFGI